MQNFIESNQVHFKSFLTVSRKARTLMLRKFTMSAVLLDQHFFLRGSTSWAMIQSPVFHYHCVLFYFHADP